MPVILYRESTVVLDEIDSSDITFGITTETSIDALSRSIETVGLMSPPWLIQHKKGYQIAGGFRRIKACRSLGCENIRARVLEADVTAQKYAEIAIADNALQRPLNLIEISRSLNLLSAFYPDPPSLCKKAASLGLPGSISQVEKLKELACLPWPIQKYILSGTLSLSIALELGRFEERTAVILANIFDDLKLSLNKQREWLTLIREIALREDLSVPAVMADRCLLSVLDNGHLDRNQKAQMLRSYLKKRRFPAITEAERVFENHVKRLKLDSHIKLAAPRHFEGSQYCLTLYFKNLKELQQRQATLDKIIHHPSLAKILC